MHRVHFSLAILTPMIFVAGCAHVTHRVVTSSALLFDRLPANIDPSEFSYRNEPQSPSSVINFDYKQVYLRERLYDHQTDLFPDRGHYNRRLLIIHEGWGGQRVGP